MQFGADFGTFFYAFRRLCVLSPFVAYRTVFAVFVAVDLSAPEKKTQKKTLRDAIFGSKDTTNKRMMATASAIFDLDENSTLKTTTITNKQTNRVLEIRQQQQFDDSLLELSLNTRTNERTNKDAPLKQHEISLRYFSSSVEMKETHAHIHMHNKQFSGTKKK